MPPSDAPRSCTMKTEDDMLVLQYGPRTFLVPTPSDYQSAIELAMIYLDHIPANRMRFLAKVNKIDDEVEINPDAWPLIASQTQTFTVVDINERNHSDCDGDMIKVKIEAMYDSGPTSSNVAEALSDIDGDPIKVELDSKGVPIGLTGKAKKQWRGIQHRSTPAFIAKRKASQKEKKRIKREEARRLEALAQLAETTETTETTEALTSQ